MLCNRPGLLRSVPVPLPFFRSLPRLAGFFRLLGEKAFGIGICYYIWLDLLSVFILTVFHCRRSPGIQVPPQWEEPLASQPRHAFPRRC